ncbi:MAG: cob(I)yrinic acid a,c-diamide adenosyltransferase [Bacteroidota bacterium]
MKIYTKTGDSGKTSLFGGKRVPKDALRIETYGTVDELNTLIGIVRAGKVNGKFESILEEIQIDLFTLGADLATPEDPRRKRVKRISASHISRLENHIDAIDPTLKPLRNFILPGGNQSSAMLHFARAVCRRAERLAVKLEHEEHIGSQPVIYLNRLSDLLFVLARKANALGHVHERTWKP